MPDVWPNVITGLTVVAAWFSLHRRMNGSGPLAQKMDLLNGRLDTMCQHLGRVDKRVAKLEKRTG